MKEPQPIIPMDPLRAIYSRFLPGEHVVIKPLSTTGVVTEVSIGLGGIATYRVDYWHDGQNRNDWLLADWLA